MLDLEQIRRFLQDRDINAVAQATGLHYNQVRRIKNGETQNPRLNAMRALSAYFKSQPQL